ncbi:hypothetical protein AGMMS49992_15240 [Clostridia bacterium]|nr:hypothetical protein AGMMS49992_15240 [Clostridia bacterium]
MARDFFGIDSEMPRGTREAVKEDYRLTKAEQEAHVILNEADDHLVYDATTPARVRYIERMLAKYPDDVTLKRRDKYGLKVWMPSAWFRDPAPPMKQNLTDEQRAVLAEKMRMVRAKLSGNSLDLNE